MEKGLSMNARTEITKKFATAYKASSKADKSVLLDQVCEVTGWSRDNARRRLSHTARPRRSAAPRQRSRKYSFDALKVLQRVWSLSGGQCGKYLVVSLPVLLDQLETHQELTLGNNRYDVAVRTQLLTMSAATIDRYLAPARAQTPLFGHSTTTPSPLLRQSITVRKAGDEVEAVPGFFEVDTVAHCGPVLKGEFARTLNLTDMHTGWVHPISIRNNAHVHIRAAITAALEGIPFEVTGMDFDNGSEFINHDLIGWAAERDIYFTRSRPYKKNDQATIESKNNHVVRKYAYYWRYDTPEALVLLNRLWPLVRDRMNYLTPTKKPVGWASTPDGRRTRLFDTPATPVDRLLASQAVSVEQRQQLVNKRESLNPAHLAREIDRVQQQLTALSKRATLELEAAQYKPLPDITKGLKLRQAS